MDETYDAGENGERTDFACAFGRETIKYYDKSFAEKTDHTGVVYRKNHLYL